MIQIQKKLGVERTFLNLIKLIYKKHKYVHLLLNSEMLKNYPSEFRNKTKTIITTTATTLPTSKRTNVLITGQMDKIFEQALQQDVIKMANSMKMCFT